jgi:hypothetical protein
MSTAADLWVDRYKQRYPHATDDYRRDGQWRQPRAEALTRRYLQPFNRAVRTALVLDVDDDAARWAARNAELPDPTVITLNPATEHVHMWWLLQSAVYTQDAQRLAALRLYERLYRGLVWAVEGADHGYAAQLTQNPLHGHWETFWGPAEPYRMRDLSAALGDRMPEPLKPGKKIEIRTDVGRNLELFDREREWEYRQYRLAGRPPLALWLPIAEQHARETSATLDANAWRGGPLSDREATHVGTSIARFCAAKLTDAEFRRRQALAGAITTEKKRQANQDRATQPRPGRRTIDRTALFTESLEITL